MKTIKIDHENDGVRIDRILRKELSSLSLSEIYGSIRKGNIRVNGRRVKQGYRLKNGDAVEITIGKAQLDSDKKYPDTMLTSLVQTDFFNKNFKIIYEDEWLIVCNKPAGLVVHGGTRHLKHDTLIDLAKSYVLLNSKKKSIEPVLVHRLDRDTSGVILIAKDKQTLRHLHQSIRSHDVEKKYLALCHGIPSAKKGSIELPLVRTHERNKGMKVRVHKDGIGSQSSFRVMASFRRASQIEIHLQTGRTHQIRVHMAYISCPVIGDARYGDHERDRLLFHQNSSMRRLYLHAEQLSFQHPGLGRRVTFTAPAPAVFKSILGYL